MTYTGEPAVPLLQQTDLIESLADNLINLVPALRRKVLHMELANTDTNLPLSHAQVLSVLAREGELSMSDIAARLSVAKPNITPVIERLMLQGFVTRIKNQQDRRVVNIRITADGHEALDFVRKHTSMQVARWAERVTHADLYELSNCFETMSRILNDIYEK